MSNLVKTFPDFWTVDENTNVRSLTRINSGDLIELYEQQFGDRLGFNLLTLEIQIDDRGLSDLEQSLLYMQLAKKGLKVGKDSAIDALFTAALSNSFNPLQAYLEKIENNSEVYPTNIETVAKDFLNTTEPLFDRMMKVFLIGAVKRAFERGCKHDTMLVIKGEQGIGKSSFFKALVPEDSWFTDTPQQNNQKRLMQLQTNWIVEIAELENLTTKNEAGEIKALLSSCIDNFCPPYGRKLTRSDRPSVLVGTCNKDSFLNDPTGSRRFHVIRLANSVDEKINTELVSTERDAIWKAAILAYRSGENNYLNVEDQLLSEEFNGDYQIDNPYYSKLAEWIPNAPDLFTLRMALEYSNIIGSNEIPKKYDQQLAGEALRELGYNKVQKRIDGVRERYWYKVGGVADPNVPKSEGVKVTPKTPAVSNKEGELSPVPYSSNKDGNTVRKQLPKAIRCETSEKLVTQYREDGKTVTGFNVASHTMTPEEREKWDKARNEKYKDYEKFWNI